MTQVLTTLLGFILGILSSWSFWRYLLHLKPRVRISPIMLKGRHPPYPGQSVYRIKVINDGSRQVIELNGDARIQECVGDRRITVRKLELRFDSNYLGGKHTEGDPWGLRPAFSFLVLGEDNLEKELSEHRRVTFILSATDAISGTTVIYRSSYTPSDIHNGNFKPGLSFDIEQSNIETES